MYFGNVIEIEGELARQMYLRPHLKEVYRQRMGEEPDQFVTLPPLFSMGLPGGQ